MILIDVSGSMSSPFDSYYYDSMGATVYLTPEGLLKWAEWMVARHSAGWLRNNAYPMPIYAPALRRTVPSQ